MRDRKPLVKAICFKGQKGDKGDKGDTGETGVSVSNIAKTSTSGNVDTYTITMTDGTTYTFTVRNGEHKQAYISQAAYDALVAAGTVDPECYYYIIDDHTGEEIEAAIAELGEAISVYDNISYWNRGSVDPGFYLVVLESNEGTQNPVTQYITGSIFLGTVSALTDNGLTYSTPFFWTSLRYTGTKMTLRLKAVYDHETRKYDLSVVDEDGNNPNSYGSFGRQFYVRVQRVFRTIGG